MINKKQIERIKDFKSILVDVEEISIEKTLSNFKKEISPEKEIKSWEHIANAYQSYVSQKSIKDLAVKKEVFSIILATSMGVGFKKV